MNFFKKNIGLILTQIAIIFVVSLIMPFSIYAQTTPGSTNAPATTAGSTNTTCPANQLCNPLKVNSIQDVLFLIVNIATYIGVILGVLALIWVGFKFIAAQGKPEELKDARRFFYAVVIGIAILIGASAIVTIIKNTLTTAGVVQSGVFGS
jgi:Sec-independent protein secretion pathway component TatC